MVHWCGACHRTSNAKVRESAKVNKRNLSERTRIFSVYLLPLPVLGLMYIYVCVCVCVCVCTQALLSIRWGFDGDFYSLWVTALRGVDCKLSSQRHGGELMFCNSLWLDEGELARPRVATITSRTRLEIFLVPAYGYKRY